MASVAYLDLKYDKTYFTNKIYENAITITALVDDCQIGFYAEENSQIGLSISYDNGMSWTNVYLPSESNFFYPDTLNEGNSIMIVGVNNHYYNGCNGLHIFSEENNYFSVSGNLTSLLDSDISRVEQEWSLAKNQMTNCFASLFGVFSTDNYQTYYRSYVKDASGLTFPELDPVLNFYIYMFEGCTSLEKAPKQLSTKVNASSSCYGMFKDCTSLVVAPELPATILSYFCYQNMFEGCTSLTTGPSILPATTLAISCYQEMFTGCTSLILPPKLPAMSISYSSYDSMFKNCTSLTTPPDLPATTLSGGCYRNMFEGCTSLTAAPDLPATTLASGCYSGMFKDCESLSYIKILATSWPGMLSRNIAGWVENVAPTGTFIKDINTTYTLDSDSGVPTGWTVYDTGEYVVQSYNVYISVDPEGYGTASGEGEYIEDSSVTVIATPSSGYVFIGWYDDNGTLLSRQETYTFIITDNTYLYARFIVDEDAVYYTVTVQQNVNILPAPIGGGTYLEHSMCTITAYNHTDYTFIGWSLNGVIVSSQLTHTFPVNYACTYIAMYEYTPPVTYDVTLYSNDNTMGSCSGSGTYLENTSATIQATANNGYEFVCWKDSNDNIYSTNSTVTLTVTQDIVLYAEFEIYDSFKHQYFTIQAIDDHLQVIMTALNYREMPYGNVTQNFNIWYQINDGEWNNIVFDYDHDDESTGWANSRTICTLRENETVKIHTDANTLGNISLLRAIFTICHIGELPFSDGRDVDPTKWLYDAKYNVYGNVLSLIDYTSGELTGANYNNPDNPTFTDITLSGGVFCRLFAMTQIQSALNLRIPNIPLSSQALQEAFYECPYLTTAPELPATTLANKCYYDMFSGCSSLTTAPSLPATVLANNCYASMFQGCSSLTTAPTLPVTTLANYCYSSMFSDCTSLTTAPELPATTLKYRCYYYMFEGCTSLNYVKCLATTIANESTKNWLVAVSQTGTFIKNTLTEWSSGGSGIPTNWIIQNA